MKSNGVNIHQHQHHVTSAKAVMWFYELKEKQADKNPETTQTDINRHYEHFCLLCFRKPYAWRLLQEDVNKTGFHCSALTHSHSNSLLTTERLDM